MRKAKKKRTYSYQKESWVCYALAIFVAVICVFPLWMAVCASFSTEADIVAKGYPMWIPENANIESYQYLLFTQGTMILRALGVTVGSVALGTVVSMVVMICYAYAASQKEEVFEFSSFVSMFAWFTTVFSGGIIPWYILCTRYYHLTNNIWALVLPTAMSTFHMFLLRNNFRAVPYDLTEAAIIDGASPARIMISVILPLSKVGIVTVATFTLLRYWNDFNLALYLSTNPKWFTLQKVLYNMMTNLQQMFASENPSVAAHITASPNTVRMALTVITVLPVVVVYPFVQRFLVQGVTVGAVKG